MVSVRSRVIYVWSPCAEIILQKRLPSQHRPLNHGKQLIWRITLDIVFEIGSRCASNLSHQFLVCSYLTQWFVIYVLELLIYFVSRSRSFIRHFDLAYKFSWGRNTSFLAHIYLYALY